MLDKKELAEKIAEAIGATDKDDKPIDPTPEMETYAEAVITTLTTSTFSHLLVEGTTAPGAPLSAGKAENGLFLPPLLPAPWQGIMASGFPTSDPATLLKEATGSTTYLTGAALINFETGNISGTCTNTPVAPGPLVLGQGQMGKIDGIDGSAWSSSVAPPDGDPNLSEKIYTAIADYIIEKAEGSYLPGTINGLCPPAGGPMTVGLGVGGTIK